MFKTLPDAPAGEMLTLHFEDQILSVPAGTTVAAALLLAGVSATRTTPVSGAPRAAYCMMGVCFECLMVIDGMANRQACMVAVTDGMTVRRQNGGGDIV